MRRTAGVLLAVAGMVIAHVAVVSTPARAAVLPTGFVDELVATVGSPTAMAFTPDGRLLVTTQGGTLRIVKGGQLLPTPGVDLTPKICSNSERGLLGIAVDPNFATNSFVFLYYTFKKGASCDGTAVNRVARFVMTGDTLGAEVVLIDNIHSPAGNHNAGDLHFGKDGNLYVSVGDGGCDYASPGNCAGANDAARDQHVLLGKILRITRDGGIPTDNPFQGAGTARCNVTGSTTAGNKCQETFAWGLRNPFRMAFDPNAAGTRFYINDVGQGAWEEIDLAAAGADYGWNLREGFCATGSTTNCGPPPVGMTNPIFAYGRSDGCATITGGAFVPNGIWPSAYQGKYLFADYLCGKIFRLDPNGSGGFNRVDFVTGLGDRSATSLLFGPYGRTQALYYTSYEAGGQVRRVVHIPSIPPFSGQGFTQFHDGASTKSGPGSTVISAFATGVRPNSSFRLVSAPVQINPDLRCTVDVLPVHGSTRFSNSRGFVATTAGVVNRPPGDYDVCFTALDGSTVGLPVRFTVS